MGSGTRLKQRGVLVFGLPAPRTYFQLNAEINIMKKFNEIVDRGSRLRPRLSIV
jgi:hypothetical protein